MSKLMILGAGGHGRVVAEAALESGVATEIAFLDDRFPNADDVDGYPVVGRFDDLWSRFDSGISVAVAIGNNRDRVRLLSKALGSGFPCPPIIHPAAYVSRGASLGDGVVVLAGAIVNIGSRLQNGCIANTGCTIDHDCSLERGVHISPGANLAGNVTVGQYAWIGIGATVNQCLSVGDDSIVGASAAVVHDVPASKRVVGIPARDLVGR